MRKVIVSNLISLDGFIAGPNGEIDWFASTVDKEFEAYSIELISSIDMMLFGRVTYELMAGYWPTAKPEADDVRIIEAMNNCKKIVFSQTLKKADWKNTRIVHGDVAEEVTKLKQENGKDMVIYGSGDIVSALARKDLIDDYRIFVVPVVLGSGIPMFKNLSERLMLKPVETRSFKPGIVLLRYSH